MLTAVGVRVGVLVAVAVGVGVLVGVEVGAGAVLVAVAVGVLLGVTVAVAVGVGVGQTEKANGVLGLYPQPNPKKSMLISKLVSDESIINSIAPTLAKLKPGCLFISMKLINSSFGGVPASTKSFGTATEPSAYIDPSLLDES